MGILSNTYYERYIRADEDWLVRTLWGGHDLQPGNAALPLIITHRKTNTIHKYQVLEELNKSTHAILLNSRGFKDIKYNMSNGHCPLDIVQLRIHKYTIFHVRRGFCLVSTDILTIWVPHTVEYYLVCYFSSIQRQSQTWQWMNELHLWRKRAGGRGRRGREKLRATRDTLTGWKYP